MLRRLAIAVARVFPSSLKHRIHQHSSLSRIASRSFARLVSVDGGIAVIESGPLHGVKLAVSEHTSHAHLSGQYEIDTQLAIDRNIQPGFVCYDLGASIGYLSLLMARKALHVYAFEPAPHAVKEIRNHIAVNRIENITIIEKPVSNEVFEVEFALNDNAYGNEIVRHETHWPTIKLTTTTLDDFIQDHPAPDFIKIDVEGEEGRVLLGALKLLSEKRPIICCELHGEKVAKEVKGILTGYGYDITTLDGQPFEVTGSIIPGEVQVIAKRHGGSMP